MGHQIEYYSSKVTTEKNLKLFISSITGNAYDPRESGGYHGNLTIEDEACRYFKSSERYIHMYLNILEKGIPQLRVMVEKGKVSVAFASRITGLSVKKQRAIVTQIKKCNRIVDANRFIASYMKNEKGKKYAETKKEYPLLKNNQDFFPVFCNSAEALLNNATILKETEKAAIINLCKNLIEKYKE